MADYYSSYYNSDGTEASTGELHVGPNVGICNVSITAGLATNDTIHLIPLKAGYKLGYLDLWSSDLDTNGTPTLTCAVGVTGATTTFGSGLSTLRDTAKFDGDWGANFYGYEATSDVSLLVTITAGAATGTTGTVFACLLFNT